MALLKGKHTIAEIEGVRCTVIESGISMERADFLKNILVYNGYDVKLEKEKAKDGTETGSLILGVSDVLFNPMIVVYQKKLIRKDGEFVTPAYWNQWPDQDTIPYWQVRR
jgi:hypothetical protein